MGCKCNLYLQTLPHKGVIRVISSQETYLLKIQFPKSDLSPVRNYIASESNKAVWFVSGVFTSTLFNETKLRGCGWRRELCVIESLWFRKLCITYFLWQDYYLEKNGCSWMCSSVQFAAISFFVKLSFELMESWLFFVGMFDTELMDIRNLTGHIGIICPIIL